jgi:hypothetical protein
MRYAESIVGLIFCLISLLFWFLSLSITPSAAEYPRIIIVLLGLVSLSVLIRGLVKKDYYKEAMNWKKSVPILILTILYVMVFNLVDFRLSTAVYIFTFMMVLRFAWALWKKITLSIGLTLLFYIIFGILFEVPLP